MTWDEALRRISAGEPVLDVMDEKSAIEQAEFRTWLAAQPNRAALLARYDANMRDLDTGITGAKNAWHSISEAQRRVLADMAERPRWRLERTHGGYTWNGQFACRLLTLRALCAHELMAWDGGAFDPEAAAVITERGTFVATRGRAAWELARRERAGEG